MQTFGMPPSTRIASNQPAYRSRDQATPNNVACSGLTSTNRHAAADCPRVYRSTFFHPDCTVGSGVSPDRARCHKALRSWAVPPIGNCPAPLPDSPCPEGSLIPFYPAIAWILPALHRQGSGILHSSISIAYHLIVVPLRSG